MADAILVAIVAPGSVEAQVGRVQEGVFASYGFASAVALPPLIPAAFIREAPARGLLGRIERSLHAPWRIRTAGIAWEDGSLFLRVDSGGLWRELRDGVSALCAVEERPLVPCYEGFFTGCGDAAPEERARILPEVPELSFSSATLALVSIVTTDDPSRWWRGVAWEFLQQMPLRGRREQ